MGESIWFRPFLGFEKRIKLPVHLEPNMVLNLSWEKSCEGLDTIKPAKDICAWRIRSSKILCISYLNLVNYFRKTIHLRCLTYLWNTNFRRYHSLYTFWWSESYNFWSSSSVCQYVRCFWNTHLINLICVKDTGVTLLNRILSCVLSLSTETNHWKLFSKISTILLKSVCEIEYVIRYLCTRYTINMNKLRFKVKPWVYHLWINQAVGFYKQNVWKTNVEERYFTSKNQPPGFYINETLVGNGLINYCWGQKPSILHRLCGFAEKSSWSYSKRIKKLKSFIKKTSF